MPIKVNINGTVKTVVPTGYWKTESLEQNDAKVTVDRNYYVTSKQL